MTSPTDPASDDRFVPTTRTHDASAGLARLCCGRLLSCVVAFLGGLLTWGMLQVFFPVFDIPIELQNLPTPPPGDSAARQQQAYVVGPKALECDPDLGDSRFDDGGNARHR